MDGVRKFWSSRGCCALMVALLVALVSFAPLVDLPEATYNESDAPILTALPLTAQRSNFDSCRAARRCHCASRSSCPDQEGNRIRFGQSSSAITPKPTLQSALLVRSSRKQFPPPKHHKRLNRSHCVFREELLMWTQGNRATWGSHANGEVAGYRFT